MFTTVLDMSLLKLVDSTTSTIYIFIWLVKEETYGVLLYDAGV